MFDTKEPESTLPNTHYTQLEWQKTENALREIKHWRIIGKINIRTPTDSVTAAINQWSQENDNFSLDLSSTFFGLGATKLYGNSHFITIAESGEEPLSSDQPNTLIEEALGFPLPLSYLHFWIKGIPTPYSKFKTEFNRQGLPMKLSQDQWEIEFSHYSIQNDLPFPGKIKLRRNDTKIILAVKKWSIL